MSRDSTSKNYDSMKSNEMDRLLSLYLKHRINVVTSGDNEKTEHSKLEKAAEKELEKATERELEKAAERSRHFYFINPASIEKKNPTGDTRKALQKVEELAINLYRNSWKKELYTIKKHGVLIRNYLEPALINYYDLLKEIGYEEHHEKYILDIKNVMAKDQSTSKVDEYLRIVFRDKVLKVALDLYTLQMKQQKTVPTEFKVPTSNIRSSVYVGGSNLPQSSSNSDPKDDDLYGRDEKSTYRSSHGSEAGNRASGISKTNKSKNVNNDQNKLYNTGGIMTGKLDDKLNKTQFDKGNMNQDQGTVKTWEKIEEKPKEHDKQKGQEKKKQEMNKVENIMKETFDDKIRKMQFDKDDNKKMQEIFKEEKQRQEKRKDDEMETEQHMNESSGLQIFSNKRNSSYLHLESTKSTTVSKNIDQATNESYKENQHESKDNHLTKQSHDDKRITNHNYYDKNNTTLDKKTVPPLNMCPTEQPHDTKNVLKRSQSDEKEITPNEKTSVLSNVNDIVKDFAEKQEIGKSILSDSNPLLKLNNESCSNTDTVSNNTDLSKYRTSLKIVNVKGNDRLTRRTKSFESSLEETTGIPRSVNPGSNATNVAKPNVRHTKGQTQEKHSMKTRSQYETVKTEYATYLTTQSSDGQTSVDVGSEHGSRLKKGKERGATGSQTSSRTRSPNRCCYCSWSSGYQYQCVLCENILPICDNCLSKAKTKFKCTESGNTVYHQLIRLGIETRL